MRYFSRLISSLTINSLFKIPSSQYLGLIVIGCLAIFSSCSPTYKITSQEEPGVNMYRYSTFNWIENTKIEQSRASIPLPNSIDSTIRLAVGKQLLYRGFKTCDSNPDLMLHYHIVVKNEEIYVRDFTCESDQWNRYGRCNRMKAIEYSEGSLIIDCIDTKTGNQVWRGVAVSILQDPTFSSDYSQLERAIELIFAKFPEKAIPVLGRSWTVGH
jgi:Domain of unknown function (DUF4136)